MESLWGEEFNQEVESQKILKKSKSVQKIKVVNEKSLKSKTISIEDKLSFIEKEVYRILGVYRQNTVTLTTKEELTRYIDNAIVNDVVAVDTETNNSLDPLTCKLMGLCLYTPRQKNAYIPLNHTDLNNVRLENQVTENDITEGLTKIKTSGIKTIFHNAKFDYEVLKCTCGVEMPIYWDTLIGARLLDENEPAGLKWQYINKIDSSIEKYDIEHLFTVPYNYVNPMLFALYAATDSFMTYKLYEYQKALFEREENSKLYSLFKNIEIPLIDVLTDMELRGVGIDKEQFERLSIKYHNLLNDVKSKIDDELNILKPRIDEWRLTKEATYKQKNNSLDKNGNVKYAKSKSEQLSDPPQLNSPLQLSILLYDVLKVPVVDKSQPRGTGDAILQQIDLPIVKLIREQKTIEKLLNAFIDTLPEQVNETDGRIHSNINQYGAATGRFSVSNPNFQQIPSKNVEIRLGFKAKEGYTFVGADFSAQEPRLSAFLSQDKKMIDAFQNNRDLYATIGTGVWHNNYWDNMEHNEDGSYNADGDKRRKICKKLLLGLSYGMGIETTAQNMKVSIDEAKEIINNFYKSFSEFEKFVKNNEDFVQKNGYVEDILGRRRRLPDALLPIREFKTNETQFNPMLNTSGKHVSEKLQKLINYYDEKLNQSKSYQQRQQIQAEAKSNGIEIIQNSILISKAKRQCTNARIQGSASSMTKRAMIQIYNDKELNDLDFKLVLTVHDELIGECPKENAEKAAKRLSYIMSNCISDIVTNVPFKCDAEIEESWYLNKYSYSLQKEYKKLLEQHDENTSLNLLCINHIENSKEMIEQCLKRK